MAKKTVASLHEGSKEGRAYTKAVSYTHLDVYKRQEIYSDVISIR